MPLAPADPVALVTGANRGLGLETARQLRGLGLVVVVAARDPSLAAKAADRIGGAALTLDVAEPESVARAAEDVRARFGHLDVLVNNAGVALDGFDAHVVELTLAVNVYGAIAVTDAMAPHLARGARVVNVSSGMGSLSYLPGSLRSELGGVASREELRALVEQFQLAVRAGNHARLGWPSSAYSVSKIALNAFTRLVATELESRDVTVNAVCPGWVRTDMGGRGAPRSVEQGARGIVWAAMLPPGGPTGGFFRDGSAIGW